MECTVCVVLQVLVAVLARPTATCGSRPVIISPSDDDHCLLSANQTDISILAYNLRVLARSEDIHTRLQHYHFPT